jgi:dephospho-CoA kinase
MLRVGLTGGYATGKSYVGNALQELGCYLIRADSVGHQVLMSNGPAYLPVVQEFGRGILNSENEIDRKRLAAIVFQDPERLETLNRIVHPFVFVEEERLMTVYAEANPGGIAVVEAAILIETGSYRRYDRLIVVTCREEQQIARAMARDGSTPDQGVARLRRQMPVSEKVRYADFVIDTSGTEQDTLRQTRDVYDALRRLIA